MNESSVLISSSKTLALFSWFDPSDCGPHRTPPPGVASLCPLALAIT